MFKVALFFIFILPSFLNAKNITIAVAANVSYAIENLKKEFYLLHKDIKIHSVLGSSGKLTAQIQHGANYELFMSANMKYPQTLYEKHLAITKPRVYAQGKVALLSIKNTSLSQWKNYLKSNKVKRIAIANPKTAPYGIATKEVLKNLHIYTQLQHKFIYAESISQTLRYTINAADIGFVAQSSLYSSQLRHLQKGKNWITIDPKLYTPINQGVVLLKHASQDTRVFYNFLFTQQAQKILQNFGYTIPQDK